jgi:hypothetical protein
MTQIRTLRAWPDTIHDGVELDDGMQLHMFETYVSSNPEIVHMIATSKYLEHDKDPDNHV